MKYWIIPSIMEYGMIICALSLIYPFWIISQNKSPEAATMTVAVAGVIIAFLAAGSAFSASQKLNHYKRILKKHGLWQEDYVKKSELK